MFGHSWPTTILFCSCHFGLGVLVGLLVLFLTLTISYLTTHTLNLAHLLADRSMFLWLSLLVVSLSIVAHVLQDAFINKF